MTELTMVKESPTPPPAAVPSGEYPLSTLCLRLDVDGVGLSWTLRGDDSDVAARLPRVLDYIKRLQAKLPKPVPGSDPVPETPAPAAVPAPPLEQRADWCAIHHVAMVQQVNERGSWWSHRLPEGGYCKGKRKRAGESA